MMSVNYNLIATAVPQFIDLKTISLKKSPSNDDFIRAGYQTSFPPSTSLEKAGACKYFHLELAEGKPHLIPLQNSTEDQDGYIARISKEEGSNPLLRPHLSVSYSKAFECFCDHWIPMPFMACNDHELISDQHVDLARGWLTKSGDNKSGDLSYDLTLVFNSNLVKEERREEHRRLIVFPFKLATHEKDLENFLSQTVIANYLKKIHEQFLNKSKKKGSFQPVSFIELDNKTDDSLVALRQDAQPVAVHEEEKAFFLTFLEALELLDVLGSVNVITQDDQPPNEVDLVLDLGNSRLTAIISETGRYGLPDLEHSYALQFRDLSSPTKTYCFPVETRVEFVKPFFGPKNWNTQMTGVSEAFTWPSIVRIGPEATRLAAKSGEVAGGGPTGMSSPKRYLWDTKLNIRPWHFNNFMEGKDNSPISQSPLSKLDSCGIPISVKEETNTIELPEWLKHQNLGNHPTISPQYPRGSLMMLLLCEILAQTLSFINRPMLRNPHTDNLTPKRLRQVILTTPTAMPIIEQNIYRTWAKLAVRTVWDALSWKDFDRSRNTYNKEESGNDFRVSPDIKCDGDEASCTQVLWLDNELRKFHYNTLQLFEMMGKTRSINALGPSHNEDDAKPIPSIRIASIDIGGGTTDLSITTYAIPNPENHTRLIVAKPEFRDGVNVAGDDIVREIIKVHFFEQIKSQARRLGHTAAAEKMEQLFQNVSKIDAPPVDTQLALRGQFIRLIAHPFALAILEKYEKSDLVNSDENKLKYQISIAEVLSSQKDYLIDDENINKILNYVQIPLRKAGWEELSLKDLNIEVDLRSVDACVVNVIDPMMYDMGMLVNLYDCDLLILSGRPSRWQGLMRRPYSHVFLPPSKVVHMHKCFMAACYPFLDDAKYINDPKITVALGALQRSFLSRQSESVTIDTSAFRQKPMSNFFGAISPSNFIMEKSQQWFPFTENNGKYVPLDEPMNIDLDNLIYESRDVIFSGRMIVGYRQLNSVKWTATKLYCLDFRSTEARERAQYATYTLNITLSQALQSRGEEPKLLINAITNNITGRRVPKDDIVVTLMTLRQDEGHWFDTGII
jgi:hypothetical protein